jgi:hypothetical protein
VTFVLHMLTDTELVWGSIQTYVWGVRTWMQSQHQADPAMEVRSWDNFMAGGREFGVLPGGSVGALCLLQPHLQPHRDPECPCPQGFLRARDTTRRCNVCDVAHIKSRAWSHQARPARGALPRDQA